MTITETSFHPIQKKKKRNMNSELNYLSPKETLIVRIFKKKNEKEKNPEGWIPWNKRVGRQEGATPPPSTLPK
jgi:hypothetical protein